MDLSKTFRAFELALLEFGKFSALRSWLRACLQGGFKDFVIAWDEFVKLPIFMPTIFCRIMKFNQQATMKIDIQKLKRLSTTFMIEGTVERVVDG